MSDDLFLSLLPLTQRRFIRGGAEGRTELFLWLSAGTAQFQETWPVNLPCMGARCSLRACLRQKTERNECASCWSWGPSAFRPARSADEIFASGVMHKDGAGVPRVDGGPAEGFRGGTAAA
jgi:hypothetical protein